MSWGLLPVDKPAGITSHDVVQRVRRAYGIRRVGHAGTLDPAATGVLLLCLGEATRLLEYMTGSDKTYTGTLLLGVGTSTDDAEGQVLEIGSTQGLTLQEAERAASCLMGIIDQQVPRYSAVHIAGQRAYDLARSGADFDPPTRQVRILEFHVAPESDNTGETWLLRFQVTCSAGTYIRSLCRDFGRLLGVPAHLRSLRRTMASGMDIEECIPLTTLLGDEQRLKYLRHPLDALKHYQQLEVSLPEAERLACGQKLRYVQGNSHVWTETVFLTCGGRLVASATPIQERTGVWILKPQKVFWKRGE